MWCNHCDVVVISTVLRFTREEIMALRRPTRVLPEMLPHTEVVSEQCLEPVTLQPIDPDEVIRIWNAASDQIRTHKDARGRGRGRGKCTYIIRVWRRDIKLYILFCCARFLT